MRVTTRSLAKGARCAPPLDPPGRGAHLNPRPEGRGFGFAPLHRLADASPVRRAFELSRHPHDRGVSHASDTFDQAFAAVDLHQGFALGDEQRAFLPLCNLDQPSAVWMPSALPSLNHGEEFRLLDLRPNDAVWTA